MDLLDKLLNRNKLRDRKGIMRNLRVGDIVSYDLVDYFVVGLIKYEDSGFKWITYQLESKADRVRLVIEQDNSLEISIFHPVQIDTGDRPPSRINYDSKTFCLNEAGTAIITSVKGQAEAHPGQQIKYWKYEDENEGYVLSIKLKNDNIEAGYGHYVHEKELNIMTG